MGAHDLSIIMVGRYKDPSEAYATAIIDAEHEYGHDGYNGGSSMMIN